MHRRDLDFYRECTYLGSLGRNLTVRHTTLSRQFEDPSKDPVKKTDRTIRDWPERETGTDRWIADRVQRRGLNALRTSDSDYGRVAICPDPTRISLQPPKYCLEPSSWFCRPLHLDGNCPPSYETCREVHVHGTKLAARPCQ